MKVAFYRHSLLNRGGDKMVITYANYLAEKGHEVEIWTNILDTKFKISTKVNINLIPLPGKIGTILWALCCPITADLVVADIIVMALVLSFFNRNRVIYFAQDYDVSYYPDRLRKKLIGFIYRVGLSVLKIPCVSVSYSLGQELTTYCNSVKVIQNGIDFDVFYPERTPALLATKKGRRSVLVFGRKDPRKGLDIALEVIRALSDKVEREALQIWVVGDIIEGNSTYCDVWNFGCVDEDNLRKILSCADVFLYPSRHEGLPLFVLEALACECPIVTTKAVGILTHLKEAWVSKIEDVNSLEEGLLCVLFECSRRIFVRKGKCLVRRYSVIEACSRFEKFVVGYANRY